MAAITARICRATPSATVAPGLSFVGGNQSKLNRGKFQFSISAAAI